ncbi:MAG TPA: DUF5667 domain-containing protein [Pseudonocardia sp.]|jgi:hypothetical protein|nr:DUF5667 domain-containing protein [Pseudonocardia sp.]
MSAGRGADAERFAAAVEQGTPPGSADDAEFAQELEIVAMLRSRPSAYDPDPATKARAKQRLMALARQQAAEPAPQELTAPLTPVADLLAAARPADAPGTPDTEVTARIEPVTEPDVAEDTGPGRVVAAEETGTPRARRAGRHQMPSRPAGRGRAGRTPAARGGLRRRAAVVASAAMLMVVALATAGVVASRDALPGDALYGVKRMAESAGLALTFDDEAKARRQLELAALRLDEVEALLGRGQVATADPQLVRATIREFDDATSAGSRMLLGDEAQDDAAELATLRGWAAEQSARLSELRSVLPVPLVADAEGSIALLDRLLGRTDALAERSSCSEVTSESVDDLGPLPADGVCAPRAATGPGDEDEDAGEPGADPAGRSGPGTEQRNDVTATDAPEPGLLGGGADGVTGEDGAPSSSSSTAPSGSVPTSPSPSRAPLLPPITLPPLLPGMPGLTIGG